MKTIYLIFVLFTDAEGYEEMHQASDMQFDTMEECQAEIQHYDVNFFCGDSNLFFNKEQVFY